MRLLIIGCLPMLSIRRTVLSKPKLLEHAHVALFAPFGPKVNKNQRTRVFKLSKKDCH